MTQVLSYEAAAIGSPNKWFWSEPLCYIYYKQANCSNLYITSDICSGEPNTSAHYIGNLRHAVKTQVPINQMPTFLNSYKFPHYMTYEYGVFTHSYNVIKFKVCRHEHWDGGGSQGSLMTNTHSFSFHFSESLRRTWQLLLKSVSVMKFQLENYCSHEIAIISPFECSKNINNYQDIYSLLQTFKLINH